MIFFHITNEDILEMFQEKHSPKGVGLACVHVEIPYDVLRPNHDDFVHNWSWRWKHNKVN